MTGAPWSGWSTADVVFVVGVAVVLTVAFVGWSGSRRDASGPSDGQRRLRRAPD